MATEAPRFTHSAPGDNPKLQVAIQFAKDPTQDGSFWMRLLPHKHLPLVMCAFQFMKAGEDPATKKEVWGLRSVMHMTDPMLIAEAFFKALANKNVGVLTFPPFLLSDPFVRVSGTGAFFRGDEDGLVDEAIGGFRPLFMTISDFQGS